MAIFLAKFSKVNNYSNSILKDTNAFKKYLPSEPKNIEKFNIGKCEAVVFYFDAALDRRVVTNIHQKEIILCHGYGDQNLENKISNAFANKLPLDLSQFPEAFCAIKLTEDQISFGSSGVGIDPLFYYQDDEQLIVTNRHNLLGNWVRAPELRKQALAWTIGRSHIGDFGTYWNEIKKTIPGCTYIASEQSLFQYKLNYASLYRSVSNHEISDYIEDVANSFCNIIDSSDRGLRFWLSGGKDSRAIVGLLSKAKRFKDISFSTFGEKFQPDVMSAQLLAKELNISHRHIIHPSSMSMPTVNIAKEISFDLLTDSVGSSLADFRKITFSDMLIIGGHENGFKALGNKLDLPEYIQNRRYWADNLGTLNTDMFDDINGWYQQQLKEVLEGCPKSRYPQIDAILFRNGTYLSGAQINSHISRSEIHPFLDGRMMRLLLGVSDEALNNQLIHYIMMRKSDAILEKIPFANDRWPADTQQIANSINLPFRATPDIPYLFQPYFPSSKVFGGYSWRLELIERTKHFVLQYLYDNRDFFDFVNFKRIQELSERNPNSLDITSIYYHLSLLKVCLIHYFNNEDILFDFSKREIIESKISTLFNASEIRHTDTPEKQIIEAYKTKLNNYEVAIAEVAERDRKSATILQTKINSSIAITLSKILINDNQKLKSELDKLGFNLLSKDGLYIGKIHKSCPAQVNGYMLSILNEKNKVLIALKGTSKDHTVEGFSWSEHGKFWFRYVNTNLDNIEFDIQIPALEADCEIHLIPWYPQSDIYTSNITMG
ncbi:hypothetical protein [Neisseria dentiae]|uniref:hypothetical protein n=1 Tax=Neisseria dentiae TaxID=194197 RepID=UPI0035A03BC2